ncbi:hypothetical protein KJA13_04250, partial [Patescibacteria group bacterium]|nr:hypothetical protein [Patescibacteria group bacterium]
MEKRLHIDKFKILVLAILLFLSFLYTRNLLFRPGTLAGLDWSISPEPAQMIQSFKEALYTWRYYGIFTGFNANPLWLSGIHQTTINAIFGYLGVSGAIYSKLSVFAILFIAGLSAYLLFIKFNVSKLSAIFGAVIYMSSPLLFNWINMVGSYAHTSCYAFLPLSFFLFLKALESHHWQVYAILTTFSMIHTSPVFGFALSMMIIIPYSFMLILFNNDRKDKIKKVCRSLLLIFILFFLLESFWLIPAILYGSEELAAIRPQEWGGLKYKIVNSLRLWGFYLFEYEFISLNSIFKGFPSFFLPILAFSSILFYTSEQKKNILFFSIYSICIIFFASSSFSIYLIRKNILFLGIFRDISKILITLSLCLALLSAFALNEIHKRTKRPSRKNILAKIILLIILTMYIFPYLSGNFGGRMISSNVFPKDYNEINNWLQKQSEDFKVLWIPTGAVYLRSKEVGKDAHVADFFGIYSPKPGVIGEIVYRYKLIPEYWVSNYFYDNNLNN